MAERWATFDCYGTIVDWNAGIRSELEKLFGVEHADRLLARYHELEPEIQAANPGHSYREVLTIALERLAEEEGLTLPEGEASALAQSLPSWPVFEDAHGALDRGEGARLAARDPLQHRPRPASRRRWRRSGSTFDDAIVAGDIGSYKPAHGHWEVFREQHGGDVEHVHVAQSLFHDIAPAKRARDSRASGSTAWASRRTRAPTGRSPSLAGLADTLDELVAERAR